MHPRLTELAAIVNDLHDLHDKVLDLIEASNSEPFPKHEDLEDIPHDLAGLEYQLGYFADILSGPLPASARTAGQPDA